MLTRTSFSFITKVKAMAKVKDKDLCFPGAKAKDIVSSRTFQGLLPSQCFIITLFYVDLKYKQALLT